jgi:hypothetical protein
MNWLKKGPELKLSSLEVPDFLLDVYYDLKERHLLPLVAVLAVSIVVVPIAISQSQGSDVAEEAPIALPSSVEGSSGTLTVAKSSPGLRDYRRRLHDARALDPFREAAAAADESATGATEASQTSSSSEFSEVPTEPTEVPVESAATPVEALPPVGVPSESGSNGAGQGQAKYASQTLDVRIVTVPKQEEGAKSSAKPQAQVRRQLAELTMLPSRSAPVAIFMGASSDGKKALLLVSSDVQSIFGDGQCIVGSQTCQLLALEAGVPETFVYGPQGRTYRIEVLKIARTLTSKPRKASLGKPKGEGSGDKEAPAEAGRISSAQPR